MSSPKRAKYGVKDLATKVEIHEAVWKGKLSCQAVMSKYNMKRTSLATYVKNEVKIMEAFRSETFSVTRRRPRSAAHSKLEKALFRWVEQVPSMKVSLSDLLIRQQAKVFALIMGIASFQASE